MQNAHSPRARKFPSRGSGGAWSPARRRGPRLHSTAKKRSKGGSPRRWRNIHVHAFARSRARLRYKDTCTEGGVEGEEGGQQPPTRAPASSACLRWKEEREGEISAESRGPETRVKPSSLIGTHSSRPARRRKENGVVSASLLGRTLRQPSPRSLSLSVSRHGCS